MARQPQLVGTDGRRPRTDLPAYSGRLDAKGRCCGRKPLSYKREPAHLYCPRCDRAFDPTTGKQVENWAFSKCKGCGSWIKGGELACGECVCEEESL